MVQPIRDSSFKRVLLPNKAMKFLATNLRCEKKKSAASYSLAHRGRDRS